jgi:hypothetical protein
MPKIPTFKEFTDPCWKGYQMVGMKTQNGKEVPNCVPEEQESADVQTSTPADREWGTDSLVRIYKQMTPGQTDEAWERNPNCQQCRTKLSPAELKRGDRVCGKCVKQNKGRVWGKDSDDDYEEQMDLVPMRSVNEHIVKVKDGYRLVSKKTGKNLGTYPTKAGAEKRERQVQYFKSRTEGVLSFKEWSEKCGDT